MNSFLLLFFLQLPGIFQPLLANKQHEPYHQAFYEESYINYHLTIFRAHKLIAHQEYQEALNLYRQVFNAYEFVFVNDYKAAAQLALYLGRNNEAFTYLKKGIANGWELKAIRKNEFLTRLQGEPEWKNIESQYDSLRKQYQVSLNTELRGTVKKMFEKDQRKAFWALFRFTSKGQDRYAEKRFAPHSERQLAKLNTIINTYGYPGERLIHNSYWTSVILSHHNSISERYALKDTLYVVIRPRLLKAIELGNMSPYEFAMIDDWYIAVRSGRREKQFGYLSDSLTSKERIKADTLREAIGLSSVETINTLIDIQSQTGLNFYLPQMQKIVIKD